MGSLEEKVSRLSPEQRSQAEMYIDFLLMKAGSAGPAPAHDAFPVSDHSSPAPPPIIMADEIPACLLYTSDAADDLLCVELGGRRLIQKKTH